MRGKRKREKEEESRVRGEEVMVREKGGREREEGQRR